MADKYKAITDSSPYICSDIFMKVKAYDTPVWKSRVPLLTDYLSDATKALGEQLSLVCCTASNQGSWYPFDSRGMNLGLQGTVKQVCLTIRSSRTNQFLETFAFDFTFLGLSKLFFASNQDKDLKWACLSQYMNNTVPSWLLSPILLDTCRISGGPTRAQLAMHLRGMLVKLNVVEGQLNGQLEGMRTHSSAS